MIEYTIHGILQAKIPQFEKFIPFAQRISFQFMKYDKSGWKFTFRRDTLGLLICKGGATMIENELKGFIRNRYGSVRAFVQATDLPYTTVDNILKRGIRNSSLSNVLKLCNALGISADHLAEEKIVPVSTPYTMEIGVYFDNVKRSLPRLTMDGIPVTPEELEKVFNAIQVGIGMVKHDRSLR